MLTQLFPQQPCYEHSLKTSVSIRKVVALGRFHVVFYSEIGSNFCYVLFLYLNSRGEHTRARGWPAPIHMCSAVPGMWLFVWVLPVAAADHGDRAERL